MQVLVTGGAGYIGSHTAKQLARAGYEPVVIDNFHHGHRWAVRWGPVVEMDLSNRESLHAIFRQHRFEAVIHFAGFAYVGESMADPAKYFRNNVVSTLNLLDAILNNGLVPIIVSSTCSTYGYPQKLPMTEDHPQQPVSAYGESKLMIERLLHWYGQAYGVPWAALRYFNAAGADPDGETGEAHHPETHLIPRAIASALGDIPGLAVFGSDYSTPDGTAVRDYIHVTDLGTAHLKALLYLIHGGPSGAFNLGTGIGYSVREVLTTVEKISGRKVAIKESQRRPGDPAILVADASLAMRKLQWKPECSSLEEIVRTAWNWHMNFQSKHGRKLRSTAWL